MSQPAIATAIDALLRGEQPDLSQLISSPEDFARFIIAIEDRDLTAEEAGDEEGAEKAGTLFTAFIVGVHEMHKEEAETQAVVKRLRSLLGVNKELEDDAIVAYLDELEETRPLLVALGCAMFIMLETVEAMEAGKPTRKGQILSENCSSLIELGMEELRERFAEEA
ncbi:MAG: hypothetical protein RL095_1303 [Verrucomicrobiota bacterium]|jgi:hypothetical protein